MDSRLLDILEKTTVTFREKTLVEIKPKDYVIASPLNNKKVNVSSSQVKTALSIICPSNLNDFRNDLVQHFEEVRSILPFCSAPKAFRIAWDLRSELLSPWDANVIADQGGQLIPINEESRIFQCNQQGVELGVNKRLILAVRHSEGNYDDTVDDLGQFTYQPPNNTAGMLRYRWCQYLGKSLDSLCFTCYNLV